MTESNALIEQLPKMPGQLEVSAEWLERREELLAEVKGIVVEDEKQFYVATDLQAALTKHSNTLEKVRKELAKPFQEAARKIKQLVDKEREPLEAAKTELKKKNAEYAEEQRKIEQKEREEAEAKAREEAEKKLAEQEMESVLFGGDGEEAPEPEPIEVETEHVQRRAVSRSARVIKNVEIVSVDEARLPRAFFSFDEGKLKRFIRDSKDDLISQLEEDPYGEYIEGVKLKITTDVRA